MQDVLDSQQGDLYGLAAQGKALFAGLRIIFGASGLIALRPNGNNVPRCLRKLREHRQRNEAEGVKSGTLRY